VNSQSEEGSTALRQASQNGHVAIVKILLDHGADTELPGFHKTTPLVIAAERGYFDIVSLLLENGANVNAQNANGSTP
ncbi:ankyrin, partial [Gymnopus androsaceus JB14]